MSECVKNSKNVFEIRIRNIPFLFAFVWEDLFALTLLLLFLFHSLDCKKKEQK
jgi:hypothetical protein